MKTRTNIQFANVIKNDAVFLITEKQLSELIEKIENKITTTLDNEGRSTKGIALTNSISNTIKTYLKKHCN